MEFFEQDDFGDLIPLHEFIAACKSGAFIDYDGFGELATATKTSKQHITPSQARNCKELPEWCTHVLWFNR